MDRIKAKLTELLTYVNDDDNRGICSHLVPLTALDYATMAKIVRQIATSWPFYSGDIGYPVPWDLTNETCPRTAYNNADNHWAVGVYSMLRRDLVRHLLANYDELEQLIFSEELKNALES